MTDKVDPSNFMYKKSNVILFKFNFLDQVTISHPSPICVEEPSMTFKESLHQPPKNVKIDKNQAVLFHYTFKLC